jgi:hypothetical protein
MTNFKTSLKKITPEPIWRVASNTYWWWFNRGRHHLAAAFSPRFRRSMEQLRMYRDRHKGERCFIIGNGPSLRRTDLTRLKGEYTFGLNRIYLLFPELGFTTTYLLSVNTLVIEQCSDEFVALTLPKFFTWRSRRWMASDPRVIFLDSDYTQPETFAVEAAGRIYEGCTVTYVALQLAFYMGFTQVILIGVDHHFKAKGPPNVPVVSEGSDPDHFHPEYFGKGFRWQLPDLECAERAYGLAREAYEAAGRQVLDATIGGKLTIFQKIDYEDLFPS